MIRLFQRRGDVVPYQTRDGSEIRELMHPAVQGNLAQSLAEATLRPGQMTLLHRHHVTEEIYHVLAGRGWMHLDGREFHMGPGDTVCIPPGKPHRLTALGEESLRILCCCSPAYRHEDTEVLEAAP